MYMHIKRINVNENYMNKKSKEIAHEKKECLKIIEQITISYLHCTSTHCLH